MRVKVLDTLEKCGEYVDILSTQTKNGQLSTNKYTALMRGINLRRQINNDIFLQKEAKKLMALLEQYVENS